MSESRPSPPLALSAVAGACGQWQRRSLQSCAGAGSEDTSARPSARARLKRNRASALPRREAPRQRGRGREG